MRTDSNFYTIIKLMRSSRLDFALKIIYFKHYTYVSLTWNDKKHRFERGFSSKTHFAKTGNSVNCFEKIRNERHYKLP